MGANGRNNWRKEHENGTHHYGIHSLFHHFSGRQMWGLWTHVGISSATTTPCLFLFHHSVLNHWIASHMNAEVITQRGERGHIFGCSLWPVNVPKLISKCVCSKAQGLIHCLHSFLSPNNSGTGTKLRLHWTVHVRCLSVNYMCQESIRTNIMYKIKLRNGIYYSRLIK